jgi:PIN domain nuclease of toxin-antitoxin system
MEITTKVRSGKLVFARSLAAGFLPQIAEEGFQELVLTCTHAEVAGNLPGHHKDPWDRLLIAQAQVERLHLVSGDRAFDRYQVSRLW